MYGIQYSRQCNVLPTIPYITFTIAIPYIALTIPYLACYSIHCLLFHTLPANPYIAYYSICCRLFHTLPLLFHTGTLSTIHYIAYQYFSTHCLIHTLPNNPYIAYRTFPYIAYYFIHCLIRETREHGVTNHMEQ